MLRERDAASRAEIVWVLKSIASSFAAASCDHIAEVFQTMFPDAVPEGLSLNAKKMTCLLTEAIYPYFQEILVEDIQKSDFLLEYDETTNSGGV